MKKYAYSSLKAFSRFVLAVALLCGALLSGWVLPAEAAPAQSGPSAAADAVKTPPPPSAVEMKELQSALSTAIAERGEAGIAYIIYQVQIDHVDMRADRNQAVIYLAFVDPDSGQVVATEPGLAIAEKGEEGWKVTLQVDDAWNETLDAVPNTLISAADKVELHPEPLDQQVQAFAAPLTGYKLPWKGGTYNYVTGSIGHVFDYKSCPNTCLYAFDFADGTMFDIYAAKAGRVKYYQDSYPNGNTANTNYLILEDSSTSPTTYQVYYHLAQSSIPAALKKAGAAVNQGQFIGKADDTGASTGHHLHFHVHATPNTVWGSSVDIRFSDVSINSGRPRTCSEASRYPDYGSQCASGNKLLSGNSTGPLPAAPKLIAPSGALSNGLPAFRWNTVTDGMQYLLSVKNSSATEVLNTTLNASACVDGVCSYTPTTALADGSYTFRVRAAAASGWGPFSATLSFSINTSLGIPEQVEPASTVYVPGPAYTWKAVDGATQYYLMVYSNASKTYIIYRTVLASSVCVDGTCSYTSTITLKHGLYQWKVRAGDGKKWGAYSPMMTFLADLGPAPAVLVSPERDSVARTSKPVYTWKASATATKYALRVLSLKSNTTVVSYDIAAVYLCSGENCSYRPSVALAAGDYQFRVRAYNKYGWGDYTEWMPFRVQLVPDAPEPVSPSGTITTLSPAYTWKKIAGVPTYYLRVWDDAAGGLIIYRTLTASAVCGAETCSYTSTINVEPGKSYKFQVRAYNSYGWGAYSEWMVFNTQE